MQNNKVIHVDKKTHSKIGKLKFEGEYDTMGDVVEEAVEIMSGIELDEEAQDEDLKTKDDFESEQKWFAYKTKHGMDR